MDQQPLILIIDDEAYFREIFSLKLGSIGYRVDTAINAEEGIQKIKTIKPNLVLMDVQMPGMTGMEALLKIKEDPTIKDQRVVFLTNLGDAQEKAREVNDKYSKDLGALGYLKKTDDLDELVAKIKSYLV